MGYRFHEVRKSECGSAVRFAQEQGCALPKGPLRHHLSLVAESEGETVAVALSIEVRPGQYVVEIAVGEAQTDEALLTELADRCLRKVQAHAIASVRLHSPGEGPTQAIWSQTSWLDRVEETPPTEPTDPAQAA